ncbi:hypothetical protein [Polaribacter sp. Asnod6-C07]|uniref:hypothetical protein n=1 Tax=Polaribacter sp. Asnod6-C07 TaxID=3160582 RepID=UPI00386D3EE6
MKKLFLLLLVVYSCTTATTETEEETTEILDKTVRIEIDTTLENDAVQIAYYDYLTDAHILEQHIFEYDSSGNAITKVITLDDYDFRYIEGEVYRNNPISDQLSLKIYVDDELVVDESKTGDGSEYINISFNYDILIGESI